MFYIYKITNLINGKVYIGFTAREPQKRWSQHKHHAKKQTNRKLYNAIRKYGVDNFRFEVIFESDDMDYTLNIKEPEFINQYNSIEEGYNYSIGGEAASFGRRDSVETRKKKSESRKGLKHSEETKAKIGNAHRGKVVSAESREKMRQSQLRAQVAARKYQVTTPTGETIIINNLKRFAKDNGLNACNLTLVAQGINRQHKGYTVCYLDGGVRKYK